ncbi:hypothetical protein PORY_001524 [Pneumocystis oryctolagi]|uniref:Uncharacterized protein n=1 Tax=Pneumocystis oryctolagi TaxID=42067 RepID=A0ACB7CEP1_9ASCO|nr:hypothetical protein PORY_001524 [Pneumocystis oryctolagi]
MEFEKKEEDSVLFKDLEKKVDDINNICLEKNTENGPVVEEIESLCMQCEDKVGITKILLTVIPFFREVILMSFECPKCGFKNSEIQSAGVIQEKGTIYTFLVESKNDLNRQIIKSETSSIFLKELDLEIPPGKGKISNIEGIIRSVLEDLELNQPLRKHQDPNIYEKVDQFITRIRDLLDGKCFPFNITLDDPTGNSWIEMQPGDSQKKWKRIDYERTLKQNTDLGLYNPEENEEDTGDKVHPDEVHKFPATCSSCTKPCDTNMKLVDIPYFKEVIIMSTVCDYCGYKSNEVKTGGEIPDKGKRITLKVKNMDDLSRDLLKSETCSIKVPELSLDLHPGTLGSRFTTLEGLLTQVYNELYERIYSKTSDSMEPEKNKQWNTFLERLQDAKNGKIEFTMILDDPISGSYLQNLYAPDPDPNMIIEEYERTYEQNEDLGINDMVLNP